MGNSGLRKIILPSDVVETQYHSLYDISTIDLDKNEVPLSQFKDKITLCVNVSSQHSETATQVAELKQLASLFPKSDFEVLAFPCNQFANEPENFRNLKRNYFDKFAVNFPVFAKVTPGLSHILTLVTLDRGQWHIYASSIQIFETTQ